MKAKGTVVMQDYIVPKTTQYQSNEQCLRDVSMRKYHMIIHLNLIVTT
jgi:hypothetical protein